MPWNHVALATKDLAATDRFYTEVMGFRLAKVVVAPTPNDTGWARHVFYDCGGGEFIAFWDLHDETITDYPTDLNESLGLPAWVNHLAWDGTDEETYQAHLRRWRAQGHTVAEIDHGFCKSIYTTDPNGILVEFCLMTGGLGPADETEAHELLATDEPPRSVPPAVVFHEPLTTAPA